MGLGEAASQLVSDSRNAAAAAAAAAIIAHQSANKTMIWPKDSAGSPVPMLIDDRLSAQSKPVIGHYIIADKFNATSSNNTSTPAAAVKEFRPDQNNQLAISETLFEYANLVRKFTAQNCTELVLLCVIITYFIYYFTRVSARPRLIGDKGSKFVQFIQTNLKQTLTRRFSPLIYFWGTNPQTCLFGYLQGQLSTDEVPRSKFRRQYLYVSDAQYLRSNVDLSKHYIMRREGKTLGHTNSSRKGAIKSLIKRIKLNHKKSRKDSRISRDILIEQKTCSFELQLDGKPRQAHSLSRHDSETPSSLPKVAEAATEGSLLEQNIRLALGEMGFLIGGGKSDGPLKEGSAQKSNLPQSKEHLTLVARVGDSINNQSLLMQTSQLRGKQRNSTASSASSASSDSGVFASSSSASSLSDIETLGGATKRAKVAKADCCSCRLTDEHDRKQSQVVFDLEVNSLLTGCSSSSSSTSSSSTSTSSSSSTSGKVQSTTGSANYNQNDRRSSGVTSGSRSREGCQFGQCAIDWFKDSHHLYHKNRLVALVSAGMTTGSDKKYVTDTVLNLEQLGFEVCVFIRRGVGGLRLKSDKFFSPSKWRDFEAAIISIREQRPGARLVAVGFSFGSLELCRYLSMSGSCSLVDAALLISCPFDPEAGGRNMRKRVLNRKIDTYLAKSLGKLLHDAMFAGRGAQAVATSGSDLDDLSYSSAASSSSSSFSSSEGEDEEAEEGQGEVRNNDRRCSSKSAKLLQNLNGSIIDLAHLPNVKSLSDFEDNFNRVVQNYPSSEAYADDSRLHELLGNIKTPTLCISSEDDFMAPLRLLPLKQIEANENLCMLLTKISGHMAFIDGMFWPKKPYFAQRIITQYIGAMRDVLLTGSGPDTKLKACTRVRQHQDPSERPLVGNSGDVHIEFGDIEEYEEVEAGQEGNGLELNLELASRQVQANESSCIDIIETQGSN